MGKIVGRLLWLLVYCSSISAAISLRILDTDHSPLVQAAAGRPFLVEVAIHDLHTTMLGQSPQVEGLDNFVVKNTGVRISTINSKVTAKYTFEVRGDTPGTYTIGPATFTDNNKQEISNTVRMVVGTEHIESSGGSQQKKETSVLLRLSVNKERVVVGERVHCWLRFYYADPTLSLQRFIEHDTKDIHRKKMVGPRGGKESLNGVAYEYVEWECDIFPQKTGRVTIPAYGADYEEEMEERDNFWGGLGRFLGNHSITKRVYSNAVSLEVDPLPTSDKPIQGVGHFTALSLSAKPAVAKQGEGIVVTLEITGDGDPDAIDITTLENIPSTLRFYSSNCGVVEPVKEGEMFKKRYEFIVQGLKTGNWEIPVQSFYYFDTKYRKLHTLKTAPLSITIMPSTKKTIKIEDRDDEVGEVAQQSQDIAPICKEWSTEGVPEWRLPWILFLLLFFIPFVWLLYALIARIRMYHAQASYQVRRSQKAFITAKKRLEIAKRHTNARDLYTLFIELFADRWHISSASISADEITQQLQKRGLNDEQCALWNDFFSRIAERAFGVQRGNDDNYLFEKAEQWIEQLERFL